MTETLGNKKSAKRCLCGLYEIEIWTGEVPEGADPGDFVRYEGTGCQAYTKRDFAPGHDAKFKGLLIRAGAAGNAVCVDNGGVREIFSAQALADGFAFGYMVAAGIKREIEKASLKAVVAKVGRGAAGRGRKSKTAQTPARIRVGRWEYEAMLDDQTQAATYTDGKGNTKVAEAAKYAVIYQDAAK